MDSSKLLSLNWRDVLQSALAAAGATVILFIYTAAKDQTLFHLTIQSLETLANGAVASFLGVIISKFFSDEQGKFLGKI